MRWEPAKGWETELKFDGDIFETEDQRNWSDATFKTYCTPLSKPFPVDVRMGDTIKQKITLNLKALRKDSVAKIKDNPPLSLTVARGGPTAKLPLIGFSDTSSYTDYSDSDIKLLSALGFQHLRCEVNLNEHGLSGGLQELKAKSVALRVPLMIALIFGNNPDLQIREFIETSHKENPDIDSIILFSNNSVSTTADLLSKVLEPLRKAFPDVKIGGGTNQYFAELNRNRVDEQHMDFLAFPSSPSSHLIDNLTIVENLQGAAGAVKTALSFSGGKPVYVSPVSLRVRSKIMTTETGRSFGDQLPSDADARQTSLFAATWTLGSVKHLAEAGAGQVTYYETTGWKGIIQGSSPPPAPSVFSAQAGAVFPMYFIFHWLGNLAGAEVIPVESSDPGKLTGLALGRNKEKYLMLANHTIETLEFPVNNFKKALIVSRLNEKNTLAFMNDPIAFFDKRKEEPVENIIRLMPFELMVLKSEI